MTGYELLGREEADAVYTLLEGKKILMAHGYGDKRDHYYVREFEKAFADKLDVKYACAVSSGTAALYVALKALGVERGDEVITSCHTFIATVEAILMAGATPVLTEVDRTLNMDPLDLAKKITEKTKCVIPVHIQGVSAEMSDICDVIGDDCLILEDAAQALGATYEGAYCGTMGDAGIFSFDFNKTMTTGEGGMIVTDDKEIDSLCRQLADHGHNAYPEMPRGEEVAMRPGFNFRMSEIQGVIGIEQLKKLPLALEVQRLNKKWMKEKLDVLGLDFREIPDPEGDSGESITYFLHNRDAALALAADYKKGGVNTRNLPDAIRWCFAEYWEHINPEWMVSFPQSRELLERAICIPVFLNDMEPSYIQKKRERREWMELGLTEETIDRIMKDVEP